MYFTLRVEYSRYELADVEFASSAVNCLIFFFLIFFLFPSEGSSSLSLLFETVLEEGTAYGM